MQTPATEDQMLEQLEDLFLSRSLYGADVSGKVRVYSKVLADVPFVILKLAVELIIRGKADGIGKDLPGTDVLLDYCERLQRDVMAKAIMVDRMLALPEMPAPREEDPAEAAANIERARSLLKPKRLEGDGG